jgi:hypothetical protein
MGRGMSKPVIWERVERLGAKKGYFFYRPGNGAVSVEAIRGITFSSKRG